MPGGIFPNRIAHGIVTVFVLSPLSLYGQDDPFTSHVRPTPPLTPEEQLAKFHLPPGFRIQLFVAEPDIQKPMNLAFDAAGRMWVTGSVEYPYAANDGAGRDTIKVLHDTTGDGRADRISTFADGLNIPIGLYPYRDGVIAYSIPHILFLRDTDHDGQADQRHVLYGPLGKPRDTHGLQNAFRRGLDGWLYINHGFANSSTIKAKDGSSIKLESGNTYRVRVDGSSVQQFTWGQVNPFGSTFTPDGDLITADCHSKPLTLLLRGAYYSSFGKPHDGLDFAPVLTPHSHGSTAIAGAAYCANSSFPKEYQGSIFVGNVMTSRVHRDKIIWSGSSAAAREEEDFVVCDDPWFRPVDLRFGPDGALYIADFYNRIIGHYEVPLDHPGRDRSRARIWRVTYESGESEGDTSHRIDLSNATVSELIQALGDGDFTRRMLAMDQLSDRFGDAAVSSLQVAVESSASPLVRVHAMWVLFRLDALTDDLVHSALSAQDPFVRLHATRILGETAAWKDVTWDVSFERLFESDAKTRRAAADAIGQHPNRSALRPLLRAIREVDENDPYLIHVLRIALRNQLSHPNAFQWLSELSIDEGDRNAVAGVCVAIRSPVAAKFLVRYIENIELSRDRLVIYLRHIARWLPESELESALQALQQRLGDDVELQIELLTGMLGSVGRENLTSQSVRQWGLQLARHLLDSCKGQSLPALGPREAARRQSIVGLLAEKLMLDELRPELQQLLVSDDTQAAVRESAARAIVELGGQPVFHAVVSSIADREIPKSLRSNICRAVASGSESDLWSVLESLMQSQSAGGQRKVAAELARTDTGVTMLLELVEQGFASARVLQIAFVRASIQALGRAELSQRLESLTENLPAASRKQVLQIQDRFARYDETAASVEHGRQVFEKHCAACHQVAGKGALVGPQLDGIGNRGVDRLMEDILDSNRNVDAAFRTTVIALDDGQVVMGLVRRVEDDRLILADGEGKEFAVTKSSISQQNVATTSIMPDNFSTLIPEDQFYDLVAWLATLRK